MTLWKHAGHWSSGVAGTSTNTLLADRLTKSFGGRRVLDAVSLSCSSGETCVVLGDNGSGKSTLLRVLAGILQPDAGTVFIRGYQLTSRDIAARRLLCYIPDATENLPDLTVQEFVALVSSLRGLAAPQEVSAWRERLKLNDVWPRRLNALSFGQRKRVWTLCALIGKPWLLLLDEPSNGLDPGGSDLMRDLLEERRVTGQLNVVASNDLSFIGGLTARRLRLRNGNLAAESV